MWIAFKFLIFFCINALLHKNKSAVESSPPLKATKILFSGDNTSKIFVESDKLFSYFSEP